MQRRVCPPAENCRGRALREGDRDAVVLRSHQLHRGLRGCTETQKRMEPDMAAVYRWLRNADNGDGIVGFVHASPCQLRPSIPSSHHVPPMTQPHHAVRNGRDRSRGGDPFKGGEVLGQAGRPELHRCIARCWRREKTVEIASPRPPSERDGCSSPAPTAAEAGLFPRSAGTA